ncbi:MAG: 16S rRNA (guanine(527)-N(7))-methyltransferase RsmG [Clostridiales bacterium]
MSDFKAELLKALSALDMVADDEKIAQCCKYYEILIAENQKMNLTAITKPQDVAIKHFVDSLYILKYVDLPQGSTLVDIGTGAGFPGLPLKIFRQDLNITLLDSLEKRCKFLESVITELSLKDINVVWARAEDAGRMENMREHFDYATARAVASLPVLMEYALPLLKIGGEFLPLKGKEEGISCENALTLLNGEIVAQCSYLLPIIEEDRIIYRIKKTAATAEKYPRRSGKVTKKPL